MNQNKLFNRTRWRLALWYVTVMGLIVSLPVFGLYKAISHSHWLALDRELELVSATLQDNIEQKLQQPGRLETSLESLLPNLSTQGRYCIQPINQRHHHLINAINQGQYYIRLFDNSGRLIATAGVYPEGLPKVFDNHLWQSLEDSRGNVYHQISLQLHTQDKRDWGYFQVGRSLKDFKDYLDTVKWMIKLGFPATMLLVAAASWWLAGLAMQPLYQSYRQIQQFTADVAHELRTPLAATQATVESTLLMPNLEDKEARDILYTIERQNRRLSQLVADLLMLARLERQPMPIQRPCCLDDVVNDLVEEFEELALAGGVALEAFREDSEPLFVIGDEDQLYRLVSNLIVNAIHYTPKSGEVKVVLSRSDYQAIIEVEDTGIGIAKAEQRQIFERFYRVNSDRSRHTGGSGLGLAIAQAIVVAHHGSLQVQSELGKGSIFTIRLPLKVTPTPK
jgi:signal transduction histidine kinase